MKGLIQLCHLNQTITAGKLLEERKKIANQKIKKKKSGNKITNYSI